MEDVLQVLDVAVDCHSAKENMKKVVQYMESEPMNLVEMITMQTLVDIPEEDEIAVQMKEFDLTFAGNKEILQAAEVTRPDYLKEAEEMLFMKMFLRYLHKNRKRVFLIVDTAELLDALIEYAKKRYSGIRISGTASMEEHGVSDDMIVNMVNGTETDCIMAFLPSPLQEQFALRNKSLLNARMWMGLGTDVKDQLMGSLVRNKLKTFFVRQFLKKKIKDEKRKSQ